MTEKSNDRKIVVDFKEVLEVEKPDLIEVVFGKQSYAKGDDFGSRAAAMLNENDIPYFTHSPYNSKGKRVLPVYVTAHIDNENGYCGMFARSVAERFASTCESKLDPVILTSEPSTRRYERCGDGFRDYIEETVEFLKEDERCEGLRVRIAPI